MNSSLVIIEMITMIILVKCKPNFDPTALMKEILIPADAAIGSIIYRLRASDSRSQYPMVFTLKDEFLTVSVENLNCSILNSLCQANVILRKILEIGRYYDFDLEVTNRRGESAKMACSFRATNATTPIAEIFPGAPSLLMISENARRNTDLGIILARGNRNRTKPVILELWGSPQFGLYQRLINDKDSQGTVRLVQSLDYETKTVHHLTLLANDPYGDTDKDTRNIAAWSLLVAVLDEQDTPPVFTIAPPTTTLSPTLQVDDLILRVHAEDGDRGKPRDVRYGLVSEGNPFTTFFVMDPDTGELRLARPLNDILAISHSNQPILLTVIAEEVRSDPLGNPSQSSTVRLALIPPGIRPGKPQFAVKEYNTLLDENSASGTILELAQPEIITQPGDVITLDLQNNNGTFEINPNVVDKGQALFKVIVHDPSLLDYEERKTVECWIVAKELSSSGNYTTRSKLIVVLNDVNDNDPKFTRDEYRGAVQENAKIGTSVLRVHANDIDREPANAIKYTDLKGAGSEFFHLDGATGVVSVSQSQGLDAEVFPNLNFFVEARDENGDGRAANAIVNIDLIDINDEKPTFDKDSYEFIVNHDKTSFTSTKASIKAYDNDLTSPNNEVRYELITPHPNLIVDERSGELIITNQWRDSDPVVLRARVWDGGIPRLSTECTLTIYSSDSQTHKMLFIVSGGSPDRSELLKTLRALTGGDVVIEEIRPFNGHESGATDLSHSPGSGERSVVVTRVDYSKSGGIVDINRIQNVLEKENREETTTTVKSSGSTLLWLLILLILLALLAALALVLCCICQGCPLYVPPKRRDTEKVLIKGSDLSRQSKSVQVAEWFGRKEAWTPENEDSLRHHEFERGGSIVSKQRQAQIHREASREQLYIRQGNTDILRLITRGNEQQRPVTLVGEQNGKDILMRRYIIDQQHQSETLLGNKLQSEHELLEASLRQQNALLRQILSEREQRDLRLETQSLPAGTQTDRDAFTQTDNDPVDDRTKRRSKSDNDCSDLSDDEHLTIRRRRKRTDKSHIRRKIKTPIQEESDEVVEIVDKVRSGTVTGGPPIKQTRTSELRRKRAIRKEVLREISASLESDDDEGVAAPPTVGIKKRKKIVQVEYFSEDSLENDDDASPKSDKLHRSESDLSRRADNSVERQIIQTTSSIKSQSQSELSKKPTVGTKRTARYMEWYDKSKKVPPPPKKKPAVGSKKKTKIPQKKTPVVGEERKVPYKESAELIKDISTKGSGGGGGGNEKKEGGPDHPLLQHSEHRFEAQYPMKKRAELGAGTTAEDTDSGIALARPPMAQKKSVFTIAYDDMHTSQIRPESTSPL